MASLSYSISFQLLSTGQGVEAVQAGTNPPDNVVATVNAGSAVIAAANTFSAGTPVVFSGSFGTVTGLSAGTTYYVIATGLSTSQFEVSATEGGTAITPGGSSSATPTVAALGVVEIRIDQTAIVADASVAGGLRPLTSGDVLTMLKYLEQYYIRDTNRFQQ